MTKNELIEAIAASTDSTKADTKKHLEAFIDVLGKNLKKQGRVQLAGLGTFTVKKRAARKGRNPATGEAIKIKASKSVGFRPALALKGKL